MDKKELSKKELIKAYKEKLPVGGVYCITCGGSGRRLIKSTVDLEGIKHRYGFSIKMGGCPDPALQKEWREYGAASFSFSVLEELKKTETQSQADFAEDVKALLDMWLEKQG